MTGRMTILPLALIAILALGFAPGPAGAQTAEEEPAFEPWAGGGHGGDGRGEPGPGRMGPGFGRGSGHGPGRSMMGPAGLRFMDAGGWHRAIWRLDLSESQKEEIKAIFESARDQVEANHEHMRALGEELRNQFENDPYDEGAVRAKAAVVADLQVEMAVLRAGQAGQVRDLLTPDQLDQLAQMKEEHKALRNKRRERLEQRRGQRPTG